MKNNHKIFNGLHPVFWAVLSVFLFPLESLSQEDPPFVLDVPYVPTPDNVVKAMLELAEVGENDVLYDLGSGDGRIPITATKTFGIKSVGIELNPEHVNMARSNATIAGVSDKVKFLEADIFKANFSEATVLTLYLFPEVNERLKPKIMQLNPGTRIVSHKYDMGDWKPEKTRKVRGPTGAEHVVYLWTVPINP